MVPLRIKRIGVPIYKSVAFDVKIAKHTEQDDFSIVELSEELPFPVANTHKV